MNEFQKSIDNRFSFLHQKDHVETGLNESEVISVWKTKNTQDS